jgi:diguanylate cyclase (GGDEF)-like protein
MPTSCTLLYAESDADLARQFQRRMAAHQIDAIFAASDMAGISALARHDVDLVVANYRLSGSSGLVLLRAARKTHPGLAAVLLVEPADLKQAGAALREEGFDYLVKDADGVYLDMLPLMAPRLIGQPWRQTNIDALTGLPGRPLFLELLKHQVQRGSRSGYNGAALLLLDIDGFKLLNKTHGNDTCDLLLAEVGRRLSEAVRESDVVGRMDGDQFGVLAIDVNTSENVEIVAGKLLGSIARPFAAGGIEISLTASIGIAFHPAEPLGVSELVNLAEHSVSQAKAAGKNRYRFD